MKPEELTLEELLKLFEHLTPEQQAEVIALMQSLSLNSERSDAAHH